MYNFKITWIILAIFVWVSCADHKKKEAKGGAGDKINKATLADHKATAVISKDTLAYTYKYLKAEEKNCKHKDDCSYVELSYPVFKNAPRLNKALKKEILAFLNDENGKARDLDAVFKEFSDDFLDEPDSTESNHMPASTVGLEINTLEQDSSVVIIQLSEEMSGGAHPNENLTFINWNTKSDREIHLNDILKKDFEENLTEIAETIFRKDEHLGKTEELGAYFFENGIFTLNDNFQITPKGLSFYYNNYEIKPYAAGPTTLIIPYSQIKSLLKPNTVIDQYIK